jgi:hypothetical protein
MQGVVVVDDLGGSSAVVIGDLVLVVDQGCAIRNAILAAEARRFHDRLAEPAYAR